MPEPEFLFAVCQLGAEPALKAELQRQWPSFRLAFSRPGFVTFRVPPGVKLHPGFDLKSTFARTYGQCWGKVCGETPERLVAAFWERVGDHGFRHLHVWERDRWRPGEHGHEPGATPLAEETARRIVGGRPGSACSLPVNQTAQPGQRIVDCVLVEPAEWWIGCHTAATPPSRWPGGVCRLTLPAELISRAYLKMEEGLRWSQFPIAEDDVCAEIGSAPGGAAQALLSRGCTVLAIDPAEVDPRLVEHHKFTHLRKRLREVRRRDLRRVRWLFVDANVAPQAILDDIAAVVADDATNIRGMLLTLKLSNWQLADSIPDFVARIRSWGYQYIRSRQLAFNRREICLAAMRNRSKRRRPAARRRSASRGARTMGGASQ